MTLKIGIDPGLKGAIAALEDGELVDLRDMPVMPVSSGGKKAKSKVNTAELAFILRWMIGKHTNVTVYLERVHSMPKQGVSSSFSFGRSFGAVEGVVGSLGLTCEYVQPEAWKRRAGLLKQPKDASRGKALELYPYADIYRKRDVDRADAILIAHYGQGAA